MTPVYAYFLPQFYSTPENDKYWGKGFTEWTNVRNAKPLFKGHRRPLLPVNDDYYDLSDPETANRVINHTQRIGLDGIAYWYYWFGNGKKALDVVPKHHLEDKSIQQNYFFAWANAPWTKAWIGRSSEVIFNQKYPLSEVDEHIDALLPFFADERYLSYDGMPLFQLNEAQDENAIGYVHRLHERYQERTGQEIKWIFPSYCVRNEFLDLPHIQSGFPTQDVLKHDRITWWKRTLSEYVLRRKPIVIPAERFMANFRKELRNNSSKTDYVPVLLSGWDNSYRYEKKGFLLDGSIEEHIATQMKIADDELNLSEVPFIIIKAYNEWAEGNILENYILDGKVHDLSTIIRDEIKSRL